jgi:hypothetical protein
MSQRVAMRRPSRQLILTATIEATPLGSSDRSPQDRSGRFGYERDWLPVGGLVKDRVVGQPAWVRAVRLHDPDVAERVGALAGKAITVPSGDHAGPSS